MKPEIKTLFLPLATNCVHQDKLGFAGFSQAEVPKTSTPSVESERKPMVCPNVGTDPFHFPPL